MAAVHVHVCIWLPNIQIYRCGCLTCTCIYVAAVHTDVSIWLPYIQMCTYGCLRYRCICMAALHVHVCIWLPHMKIYRYGCLTDKCMCMAALHVDVHIWLPYIQKMYKHGSLSRHPLAIYIEKVRVHHIHFKTAASMEISAASFIDSVVAGKVLEISIPLGMGGCVCGCVYA